jgi:hypothetical protein
LLFFSVFDLMNGTNHRASHLKKQTTIQTIKHPAHKIPKDALADNQIGKGSGG